LPLSPVWEAFTDITSKLLECGQRVMEYNKIYIDDNQ
jgi:hypothetical protein